MGVILLQVMLQSVTLHLHFIFPVHTAIDILLPTGWQFKQTNLTGEQVTGNKKQEKQVGLLKERQSTSQEGVWGWGSEDWKATLGRE